MTRSDRMNVLQLVLCSGLAGGAAEVLWVLLYSGVSDVSAAMVGREVAASLWPATASWQSAPLLGVAIHMVLALALAALCVPVLLHIAGNRAKTAAALMVAAVTALALVWAVNFFVVLPLINPKFVALMPYGATLVSKLLFGIAMAAALRSIALSPRIRARVPSSQGFLRSGAAFHRQRQARRA